MAEMFPSTDAASPLTIGSQMDTWHVRVSGAGRSQAVRQAVRQDAALEEGVELVLDKLGQAGTGSSLDMSEEGLGGLLHQAVQRGLLRAVTLVVDRGAIGRPLGLPADGLHALPPRW
jgi:hypothetical protein